MTSLKEFTSGIRSGIRYKTIKFSSQEGSGGHPVLNKGKPRLPSRINNYQLLWMDGTYIANEEGSLSAFWDFLEIIYVDENGIVATQSK